MRRGPCDLQIEAAGIGRGDELSAKYRPCTSFEAIVRGSISFVLTPPRVIMASSTGRAGDGDHKALRLLEQGAPLLPGQGIGAQRRSMPARRSSTGIMECGRGLPARILHAAVGIGLEIAREARIKLSLVQRRLPDRARGNRTSPASDAPRPTGPSGRRRRNA